MRREMVIMLMVCVVVSSTAYAAPPPTETTQYIVPGLDHSVTIYFDELGVPNVYAATAHDLVMAQGYIHAADRWWQMEWFRHVGLGRLAEIGGSAVVEYDMYTRTLGLVQNAQNDLDHLSPDVRALLDAYSAGVNAWLAGKTPGQAAAEYTLLNQLRAASGAEPVTTIEPWTPLHSVLWLHTLATELGTNPTEELIRYQIADQLGAAAVPLYMPGYQYTAQPLITEPGWTPTPRALSVGDALFPPAALSLGVAPGFPPGLGSNNWVVSGSRTASGKPLLANDPHLGIMMPSIWYEIGLHCAPVGPDCPYTASGFSFPGTPLITIGHNDRIAWGATNVGTDTQDLYVLEINPQQPDQYRYNGAWVDMDVRTETIRPWDADPVELRVQTTRFGPVVTDLLQSPVPVALRWSATDVNRDFEGFNRIVQAANWEEFQAGAAYIDLQGQNFVYADVDGHIGYVMTGRVPLRVTGHDGSMPVDGTSDTFEWLGYVDPAQNPRLFDPEIGYIVSANNAVIAPDDFPPTITVDWEPGYRAARIETLIQAQTLHTPDTFGAMQFDDWSPAAAQIVPRLAAADLDDARLLAAADWLAEWDYHTSADSPQAALFAVFWREFAIRVFDETGYYWESSDLNALESMWDVPDHPVWTNAALDTSDPVMLMAEALRVALDWMEATYGTDWASWRWGDLHVARFQNAPLGQIPDGMDPRLDTLLPLVRNLFNREIGSSGCATCLNATGWAVGSGSFDVMWLPSLRMILDVGDWENSRLTHTTGQSGYPNSPHYDDMLPLWSAGEYHAHRYDRLAVESAAVAVWTLEPGE